MNTRLLEGQSLAEQRLLVIQEAHSKVQALVSETHEGLAGLRREQQQAFNMVLYEERASLPPRTDAMEVGMLY